MHIKRTARALDVMCNFDLDQLLIFHPVVKSKSLCTMTKGPQSFKYIIRYAGVFAFLGLLAGGLFPYAIVLSQFALEFIRSPNYYFINFNEAFENLAGSLVLASFFAIPAILLSGLLGGLVGLLTAVVTLPFLVRMRKTQKFLVSTLGIVISLPTGLLTLLMTTAFIQIWAVGKVEIINLIPVSAGLVSILLSMFAYYKMTKWYFSFQV